MEKRPGNQNVSQQRKPFRSTGFLSTTPGLLKSIKEIRLLLPHSLAAFSILIGLLGTLSAALAPFFLSNGALFLCAGMLVSFVVVLLLWAPVKRKKRRLRPEDSIRYQGRAFRLWFAGHHLSWAFGSSLFIVILLVLFGPVFEVMALGAGALACTCFALVGLLIGTKTRTLGLCWQSPVPQGVDNWWDYVGTTMILRERYEHAVQHDQKRTEPILWRISRILELASHGGANRTVDLMASAYPTKKTERLHRFKVLAPLFLVTVFLAVLLPKLPGLTPPSPGQVPDGWLTGILKKSDVEDKSQNDSREKPGEQTKEKDRKEVPPADPDNKDQKGKRGEDADGQTKGDTGDRSSRDSGQDQVSADDRTGDSAGGEAGENNDQNVDGSPQEGQDQDKQTGKTRGKEKGKEKGDRDSDKNEGGTESDSQGKEEKKDKTEGSDKGKSDCDKNEGGTGSDSQGKEKKKDGTEGSDEEKGKGKCEGEKTEGDAARKDPGKSGKSQSKKGSEQESENKPGDMDTKQDLQRQDSDSTKRAGKGKEQSQSFAGSEHAPEMGSDPEVPLPPPGTTGMLELDLPPLDQGEPTSEPNDKNPPGEKSEKAPAYPTIPPKKGINKAHPSPSPGSRTYKPEQYLPNWILALMKESRRKNK